MLPVRMATRAKKSHTVSAGILSPIYRPFWIEEVSAYTGFMGAIRMATVMISLPVRDRSVTQATVMQRFACPYRFRRKSFSPHS